MTLSMDKSKTRGIIKSASTSGLSLIIKKNSEDSTDTSSLYPISPMKGASSSTTSSRDSSPCRELSPLITNFKPAMEIRKGRKGFGFTIHTVRVYFGDSNFYTMHHLVLSVDEYGSAFAAGLRPGDLLTHINGITVQGLNHTQVLKLLFGNGDYASITATALNNTSIQSGGRKRDPKIIKLAQNRHHKKQTKKNLHEKKKKSSLFRRISTKKANVDVQQMSTKSFLTPITMTSSRSYQSFPSKTDHRISCQRTTNRLSISSDSPFSSSSSSSSSSTSPNVLIDQNCIQQQQQQQNYQRPSSLHGLKQKLHPKNLHVTNTSSAQNRRKSVAGHIPVSPLARTPSPSPLPISPTRSPSPLAFSLNSTSGGYQFGSSNSIQLYSPNSITITANKKSFVRSKNSEPCSPLLFRRTLSPDRSVSSRHNSDLKPSSISPLCSNLTSISGSKTHLLRPMCSTVRKPFTSHAQLDDFESNCETKISRNSDK